MQLVLRYRRWLEEQKQSKEGDQSKSIMDMEFSLPPLRGFGASVIKYCEALESEKKHPHSELNDEQMEAPKESVEERLLEFYNGANNRFKKHGWDRDRAKQAEYQTIAASLLGVVGGSTGQKQDPTNPVLIGFGLGQFKSTERLSSISEIFGSYRSRTERALHVKEVP